MDKPTLTVGTEYVWSTKSGASPARTETIRVTAVDENDVTTQALGVDCNYTRPLGSFLLATTQGPGCNQNRVRVREWTVTKGDVWPLEAGEKFTYAYTSTDRKGKRSKGKFQCSVGKPTKVSVPAGDFDTIPVACRVSRLTRTYYLSPALGMPVKYQAKNVTSEMVSLTAGQGLNK